MSEAKTWCWPFCHKWQKWTVVEESYKGVHDTNPVSGESRVVGARVCFQRKECQRCGKVKLRRELAV